MAMSKLVYLDHSATTPVAPEVLDAMAVTWSETYGNPSSLHSAGRAAKRLLEESRESIASSLGVRHDEIVFTSGATEADNLALIGASRARAARGGHIVASNIEHHAVLHALDALRREGVESTLVEVDEFGRVDPAAVAAALRPDTFLVSILAGSNEVGTLQPIEEIGALCQKRGVLFHTDAVQALGKVSLPLDGVSLLSASAHKLHGPKGIGFLWIRKGTRLAPLIHGGGHERGVRSGTENVPGAVGFAAALRLAFAEKDQVVPRMVRLRGRLLREVLQIPGTRLNGHPSESLPHIANFSFAALEGESLIMRLDEAGIAASTGSACSSPNLEPSHVLLALRVPISMAHGSLRISTGRQTTDEDIDHLLEVLPHAVSELRAMSPFKVGE
ncbi:MAG: cysteine desulfurase family protein [Candidatus Bipolaricaulota bacterium]